MAIIAETAGVEVEHRLGLDLEVEAEADTRLIHAIKIITIIQAVIIIHHRAIIVNQGSNLIS
jgi:hypothetical protein